jgi:hypothetical protein
VTSRRRNWCPLADFRLLICTVPILDYSRIADKPLVAPLPKEIAAFLSWIAVRLSMFRFKQNNVSDREIFLPSC